MALVEYNGCELQDLDGAPRKAMTVTIDITHDGLVKKIDIDSEY